MARKSGGAPIIGPSKGARERIGEIDVDITARYLELAVPLSLELRTASNFWPRFYLGRAVALELSCDTSGDDGSARLEFDCDEIIDIPGEEDFEIRNRAFQLMLGYGFFFGG